MPGEKLACCLYAERAPVLLLRLSGPCGSVSFSGAAANVSLDFGLTTFPIGPTTSALALALRYSPGLCFCFLLDILPLSPLGPSIPRYVLPTARSVSICQVTSRSIYLHLFSSSNLSDRQDRLT